MPTVRKNPNDIGYYAELLTRILALVKEGNMPCIVAPPSQMRHCHIKWDSETGVLLCRAGTAAWLVKKGFTKEKMDGLVRGIDFRKSQYGSFSYDLIHMEESVNAILDNNISGFVYRNQACSLKQWNELSELGKLIRSELDI